MRFTILFKCIKITQHNILTNFSQNKQKARHLINWTKQFVEFRWSYINICYLKSMITVLGQPNTTTLHRQLKNNTVTIFTFSAVYALT